MPSQSEAPVPKAPCPGRAKKSMVVVILQAGARQQILDAGGSPGLYAGHLKDRRVCGSSIDNLATQTKIKHKTKLKMNLSGSYFLKK